MTLTAGHRHTGRQRGRRRGGDRILDHVARRLHRADRGARTVGLATAAGEQQIDATTRAVITDERGEMAMNPQRRGKEYDVGRHPTGHISGRVVGSIGSGSLVSPMRYRSAPAAAERPSAMAHTMRL